ncbi:MAG TPA: HU family DNA-binding protein [Longimicrobium sp.]
MNKSELVQQLASRADLSRSEAARVVDALFSVDDGIIAKTLRGGDKVQITGFGSFESKRREARKGRNPRTGKEIEITPSTSASFRPGKGLKDAFAGPGTSAGPGTGSGGPGRKGR